MAVRMDARTRCRLILAASSTHTVTDRQAVIVGAVLTSMLKLGWTHKAYVAELAYHRLVAARHDFADAHRFPTAVVSHAEIEVMRDRFFECHKEATP